MTPLLRFGARRLVWLLPLVALIAAACGSSDTPTETSTPADEVEVTDVDTSSESPDGDDHDADDGDSHDGEGNEADGDDDHGADGDDHDGGVDADEHDHDGEAADGATTPVPRDELVANLISNMTTHAPTADEVACVVDEADASDQLSVMLDGLAVNQADAVNDEGFAAFSVSLNGCLEPLVLGEWAAMTMGLAEESEDQVAGCFADRFGSDDGDRNFTGLASQALGFAAADEATSTATVDTLSECVPLTLLAAQLAGQAEARANYLFTVDEECVESAVAGDDVTRSFWTSLVSGSGEELDAMDDIVNECSNEIDDGLESEVPADFEPWQGTGDLASVNPRARNGIYLEAPPMTIDPAKTYEAVIATGGGEIRLKLFPDTAPVTVNNFVSLARDGYYDGTVFHRVIPEFMAQAGDPTGTGTGGPGYQFEDEVDNGPALDKRGLLAMANSGPATNGSQFFITFAATEWLTGNHTVFGEVLSGDDILGAVEIRDPAAPTGPGQRIESITIEES